MKSYIKHLTDYKKAPFEREVTVSCPQEHLNTNLKRLTRTGKKTVAAEKIQNGDVVVLSLDSTLEKFNKKSVFITVGSQLFDTEFERELLGKKQGEKFETEKDGHKITACIKSISRTIYPEPSDELAIKYAAEHELENINSLDDYIAYIKKEYIEEKKSSVFYSTVDSIIDYVLTHSDFAFDQSEIESIVNEDMQYIKNELAEEGKTLEALEKDELRSYFGVEKAEEVREVVCINAERTIAQVLWLAKELNLDAQAMKIQDFEDYSFDFIEEFVEDNLVIKEEL